MTTKKIDDEVNFIVSNSKNEKLYELTNQRFYDFWYFYISDILLEPGNYSVQMFESKTNKCIFNDILQVK